MARNRPPLELETLSQTLKDSRGQGVNAFFPSSTPPPAIPVEKRYESPAPKMQERDLPPVQPKPEIPERTNARTPERVKGKRIITRNSFETYEDQMDSLRRLAYREKMEGKIGSMSAMVRDAIDEYLDKRAKEI